MDEGHDSCNTDHGFFVNIRFPSLFFFAWILSNNGCQECWAEDGSEQIDPGLFLVEFARKNNVGDQDGDKKQEGPNCGECEQANEAEKSEDDCW